MPEDKIRIGLIGTAETSDRFAQFIERCSTGVDGKSQKPVAYGWADAAVVPFTAVSPSP